ncbi:MAG: MFS transporter [Anaerolineales bacterium]|nr:MFS transporter [Anaerolineales bacterium]
MQLFSALSHRPFALLWAGQTISRLGDSVYRVALAWWVLEATGSAAAMGTVLIFSSVPMLLFLLAGGVAVDRLPRLPVMVAADALNGLVMLAVAVLAAAQALAIGHVYIASALIGLAEAFFFPAYQAAVPELTPPAVLPSANSLTSLSQQLSGIAGPALGAGIVAAGGTASAFGLNGLSFFIAAACLLPLLRTIVLRPLAPGATASPLSDLRAGLALILASPWLWITILVFSLVNVTSAGPRSVALPFLVEDTLGAGVDTLGWLYSAGSVGSVLGAVMLGRLSRIRRRGGLAYGASILGGLAALLIGLAPAMATALLGSFIMGLSMVVFGLVWTNTVQALVPREALGRVFSLDALGSFVLLPVGFGLAGWATDWLGAPLVFVLGGALTALLSALPLLHPAIRGLD